jgi:hypothetical protein
VGNLLVGWSWSWWVDKHNEHHGHPNQLDLDPDIVRPFTVFTEEAAHSARGFVRFMVKYQAYFEFPTYAFAPVTFLILSIHFLLLKKAKHALIEALLLATHYLLYVGLLLLRLNIWQAVVFIIIHEVFFGLYLGSIVAPNHKGMLILDKDSPMDFLRRQVLTSRTVRGSLLVDFWYGGLNYQIEHHLFPTMPRNKLRKAQAIVKAFCIEHAITYHEASMLQSYREILHHLHKVSAPLRDDSPWLRARGFWNDTAVSSHGNSSVHAQERAQLRATPVSHGTVSNAGAFLPMALCHGTQRNTLQLERCKRTTYTFQASIEKAESVFPEASDAAFIHSPQGQSSATRICKEQGDGATRSHNAFS